MISTFQGHGLHDLFLDLVYPLGFLLFFWKGKKFLPKIGEGMNIFDLVKIILILLFLPNNFYSVFEAKHLLVQSQLVDPVNVYSYLVFGTIAVFGLLVTVYSNVVLINYYAKSTNQVLFGLIFLSLANGFGATLGLLELYSWQAITDPRLFVETIGHVITSPSYFSIFAISSGALYLCTYLFPRLTKPR